MSKGSLIALAVIVLGILCAFLGYKMHDRVKASEAARADAQVLLELTERYGADPVYVEDLIDTCHAQAFDATYKGGVLSPSELNEQDYQAELVALMLERATADNNANAIASLQGLLDGHYRHFRR
ncbi:MAG: hypothetical protein AAFX05_06050 [Planctomycetota bacterium]